MTARTVLATTLSRQRHLQVAGWSIALAWTLVAVVTCLIWDFGHQAAAVGYVAMWLFGLGGIALGYRRLVTQIAKRVRATDRILYLANHDGLTQLPNRHVFFQLLGRVVADADREGARTALLLVGLDRFRTVNDLLGHAAGDQVLREIARRLVGVVRERDAVARVGGDEFAVLLSDLPDAHVVARVANEILEAISAPIHLPGDDLAIGASIGIALYPDDADGPEDIFRAAGVAMREVKDLQKTGFNFAGAAGVAALSRPVHEKAGVSQYG